MLLVGAALVAGAWRGRLDPRWGALGAIVAAVGLIGFLFVQC
jgi:hypothetical protein